MTDVVVPAAARVGAPRDAQPLPPGPSWWAAFAATYTGQVSRAKVARVPLLFVASFQSLGILLLLRGVVSDTADLTKQSVVSGATVLVVAFVALNLLAQRLGRMRANGAVDYYAALPVRPSAVLLGITASYAAFTLPGTVVTGVLGSLLYDLPLSRLWVLVLVIPCSVASLAGIGALIGLLAPTAELATVLGQLGMSAVLFVGIIPADRLPALVRALRTVVPAAYAVDALAETFRAHVRWGVVTGDLLVCLAVGGVTLAIAAAVFGRVARGSSGKITR